jgi:hypothetical protein
VIEVERLAFKFYVSVYDPDTVEIAHCIHQLSKDPLYHSGIKDVPTLAGKIEKISSWTVSEDEKSLIIMEIKSPEVNNARMRDLLHDINFAFQRQFNTFLISSASRTMRNNLNSNERLWVERSLSVLV